MVPAIRPGERVRVEPLAPEEAIHSGDIVFVGAADGAIRIHRVAALRGQNVITQGDALRHTDAPVQRKQVLGRVAWIWEDLDGRTWRRAPAPLARWWRGSWLRRGTAWFYHEAWR